MRLRTRPIPLGFIEPCLRSIEAQEFSSSDYEVIVADGMSDDGTRTVLEGLSGEFPNVRVVDNPERITATGLNRGIRAARGEIIIRMDAHAEYAPDYIARCVETL